MPSHDKYMEEMGHNGRVNRQALLMNQRGREDDNDRTIRTPAKGGGTGRKRERENVNVKESETERQRERERERERGRT